MSDEVSSTPMDAEYWEDDSVPSVIHRTPTRPATKTPRTPDSRASIAELESEQEFSFPISRTASATGHTVSLATRQRIEELYDLLKNGAYFAGEAYEKEGISRDIANYIRGSSGWTFLHQAAFHQHEPAIEWLIKHGADRTLRGRFDGKTPYDVALTNGKAKGATRVMEMLEVKRPPHEGGLMAGRSR